MFNNIAAVKDRIVLFFARDHMNKAGKAVPNPYKSFSDVFSSLTIAMKELSIDEIK